MSIVPILKSKELISILIRAGFRVIRQSGSHIRLRHISNFTRQTSIPIHNSDIPRWLLSAILKQAKIPLKQLLQLLKK